MSNNPYAKEKKGGQAKLSGVDATPLYPAFNLSDFLISLSSSQFISHNQIRIPGMNLT